MIKAYHKIGIAFIVLFFFAQCSFYEKKLEEKTKPLPTSIDIAFHLAQSHPSPDYQEKPFRGDKLYLKKTAAVTTSDILSYSILKQPSGNDAILLKFTEAGSIKMAQTTSENIKQLLAIVINGNVVTAPVIIGPIEKGEALLDLGAYPKKEDEDLLKLFTDDFEK